MIDVEWYDENKKLIKQILKFVQMIEQDCY